MTLAVMIIYVQILSPHACFKCILDRSRRLIYLTQYHTMIHLPELYILFLQRVLMLVLPFFIPFVITESTLSTFEDIVGCIKSAMPFYKRKCHKAVRSYSDWTLLQGLWRW
jgi:hypothetical protein